MKTNWGQIPWKTVDNYIWKMQTRIYKASLHGHKAEMQRLQDILINSNAAKCKAVRRVSQDNRGKKTAGVDGIATLAPTARIKLVNLLKLDGLADPIRRVWIPKPGSDELRPQATMRDRAKQALAMMALEPEWEAKFETNSFGFRPGRSCQDAIEAIYLSINQKPKYVLDAHIAKCFDNINHEVLLSKMETFPAMRKQIKAWLKSGIMDGEKLFPSL